MVGRSALWNSSFWRLMAWICACLVTTQNGSNFSVRAIAERVVGAKPAVAVMDAVVGIGGRIDEGGGNVGGNIDIA